MELQQIAALILLFTVLFLSSTGWVHRGAVALAGALVAFLGAGAGVVGTLIPDVLLVTAGLMVLAGYVKRTGLAAWLALKAAKAAGGRPNRILVLTGVLTFVVGALVGPVAAVVLVVPVALLLAVELDVPPLPFVVVLTWTSLLGAATTLTALPGNLWLGAALHLSWLEWLQTMIPYTGGALAATLATGYLFFGKRLRVTNERRARVLEYEAARSLSEGALVWKTVTVVTLVGAGLVAGPWVGLGPSLVTVAGAVVLWLWDSPQSSERFLGDLDGATLLFFGALMVVAGFFAASGLVQSWALPVPHPLVSLLLSVLLGAGLDQGAAVGVLAPFVASWSTPSLWTTVVLGTTVGAGISILGSVAGATALGLTGQGPRKVSWREFSLSGLLFGGVNLAVVAVLLLVLN